LTEATTVNLLSIFENQDKHVAFCFGRMNPPTIGHKAVFEKLKQQGGDYKIFLSKTQDSKKNPLDYGTKIEFIKKIHPEHSDNIIEDTSIKTPIDAATYLYEQGYNHVTFVGGDDRKSMFDLIKQYNGVEGKSHGYYNFDTIDFESAGAREDDAEGLAGVSATVAREAAVNGDIEAFAKATGAGEHSEDLYKAVRQGMGIKEATGQSFKTNPVAKNMEKFNRPNTHKDRKKAMKRGDEKHKGKDMKFNEMHSESYYDDANPEVAKLGRILMDKSVSQKDEAMSNIMSTLGSELTKFGSNQGARNLPQLEKRVGLPADMIKKMMDYASKFEDETKYRVKDPEPEIEPQEAVNAPGESASRHGGNVLSALQRIVDDKSAQAVNFQDGKGKVDMFTASAIMKVYDAVNDDNKSKMKDALSTKAGFMKIAKFAMEQIGR